MDHSVMFDLEQAIMGAWGVVDDLKMVAESVNDAQIRELLNSMACLYQMRFEKTFSVFEDCVKESWR